MGDLLVVGRGPSVVGFDRWDEFPDILAVSSGIFAVPESARAACRVQFVTMDAPKWYIHQLHDAETECAWQHDDTIRPWPFWADESIAKHVQVARLGQGKTRTLPDEIWDVLPDYARAPFGRELAKNLHEFGCQPGWGDYANVRGWAFDLAGDPTFDGSAECIGMMMIRNSWFMAVQVAHRLGFDHLHFIGCDFHEERFALCAERTRYFWSLAHDARKRWTSLAPDSILSEFLPCPVPG
jgi:hypothetical protein